MGFYKILMMKILKFTIRYLQCEPQEMELKLNNSHELIGVPFIRWFTQGSPGRRRPRRPGSLSPSGCRRLRPGSHCNEIFGF